MDYCDLLQAWLSAGQEAALLAEAQMLPETPVQLRRTELLQALLKVDLPSE